jgi:hypothetical protein
LRLGEREADSTGASVEYFRGDRLRDGAAAGGDLVRLDDRAPIEVLGAAIDTEHFTMVVRAARQVASFQS